MKELDGGTGGPDDFGGLIGKQLVGYELWDGVGFEAVQGPEITIDEKDLSSDQKYLLSIFNPRTTRKLLYWEWMHRSIDRSMSSQFYRRKFFRSSVPV